MSKANYCGRFAPSPSGPLHQGSLVAAMASFLDARAHGGQWLLRIEDIDTPRVVLGSDQLIMQQLQALGMQWDGPVLWQSQRLARYQALFDTLQVQGLVYPCGCTRQAIRQAAVARGLPPNATQYPYSNHCRTHPPAQARAWRLRMPSAPVQFCDRWYGNYTQCVADYVGDIIIRRADGLFAYQWVVVIDDMDQGVTHVVRGHDLFDSTPRQQVIAGYLGAPVPQYLHVPLVVDAQGQKLSKQNHAPALDSQQALASLSQAWAFLGFSPLPARRISDFWAMATVAWGQRFL